MHEPERDMPLVKRLGFAVLALLARALCLTLRVRHVNREPLDALRAQKRQCVLAFWHGSMIPGWFFHRPRGAEQTSALVSLSKDGTILATVLEHWGFSLIRGSSHMGGKEALHRMTDALAAGQTLLITPDGPRGPRHVMKPGAALAASRAGVPLVMAGIAVERKKVFPKSWDKFEAPLPFSRVCIWYGDPVTIAPGGAQAEREDEPAPAVSDERKRIAFDRLTAELGARLNDLQANAHNALGIGAL